MQRSAIAWRPLALLSVAFAAILIALAARYGYHRDELYFLTIGGHPAAGYVDQPPLIPMLAHAVDALSGHSLVWLRVPPALAGGLVVLVTGLIAREFGGTGAAQALAATTMAISSVLMAESHLATTSVFDLLDWTVVSWLVIRALRDGGRTWLLVGLVAGIGLEVKTLLMFGLLAVLVGVLAVGPRDGLRSRWLWVGAALAVALWLPDLVWQARHGWPQLSLSKAIAEGQSGSSQPRWLFLPFQGLLIGPPLVPVWIAGLVRLWRDERLATWRGLAVAYPVLVVIFLITGGKPYYLCGMYPVLLAAGATPTIAWLSGHRARTRTFTVAAAISLVISALITLPLVPVRTLHATPIVALNYDAGETVGWPRFAATMSGAFATIPAAQRTRAIVLTENYGEAGALQRLRPQLPVYSGQNSLWDFGPPPAHTTTALVVGYSAAQLRRWFGTVTPVATIDNGVDVDDDEQGATVFACTRPSAPWPALWRQVRRLG